MIRVENDEPVPMWAKVAGVVTAVSMGVFLLANLPGRIRPQVMSESKSVVFGGVDGVDCYAPNDSPQLSLFNDIEPEHADIAARAGQAAARLGADAIAGQVCQHILLRSALSRGELLTIDLVAKAIEYRRPSRTRWVLAAQDCQAYRVDDIAQGADAHEVACEVNLGEI